MAPPILALHGFTQNRRCWGRFGERLAASRTFCPVDLAGHGSAGDLDLDLWGGAHAIAASMPRPSVVLGYSMGGRFALHLALSHPELVSALVLIGANPGIVDDGERLERHRRDLALADHVEDIGVEAFCEEWLSMPMFAGLTPATRFTEERLTNTAAGLASSLRRAGTGSQDDLWPRLAELDDLPILALAGATDSAYVGIAQRMQTAGARIDADVIAGAGHAAHLEAPDATADRILQWLAALGI